MAFLKNLNAAKKKKAAKRVYSNNVVKMAMGMSDPMAMGGKEMNQYKPMGMGVK